MRNLFLILTFLTLAVSAQGQGWGEETTFIDTLNGAGDSTFTLGSQAGFYPVGAWTYCELTVIDSGGTSNQVVDSLYAYTRKTNGMVGYWSQVGLRNLRAVTDNSVTDAGNGNTTYLIYDPHVFDLLIRRVNVADINRRTIILVTFKR